MRAKLETVFGFFSIYDKGKYFLSKMLYFQGCSSQMIDFVEEHVIYLIAVAGGVAVIQLIGMIFSICLCCALKRIEDFKA